MKISLDEKRMHLCQREKKVFSNNPITNSASLVGTISLIIKTNQSNQNKPLWTKTFYHS